MNEKTLDFKKTSKTGSIMAAIGVFIMVAALSFSFLLNVDKSQKVNFLSTHSSWAYEQAVKANKIYYLKDITQHLSVFDSLDGNKKIKVVKYRIYYSLTALKDIDSNENVFLEQYTSLSARIRPWKGPNREIMSDIAPNRYWVKFAAKKGQEKQIVTGADFLFTYPFANDPNFAIYCRAIDSNQKSFIYPNADDFIDNFNIQLDSLGPNVSLPNNATFRQDRGNCETGDPRHVYKLDTSPLQGQKQPVSRFEGYVCSWKQLKPGDAVGIIVNW